MKRLLLAAALCTGAAAALPAYAQFAKPEDAIKYRRAAFDLMSAHMGRIGAMVKGKVPFDGAAAASNAELVSMLAQLPFHGFVEGTAGNGDKGTAKPNIWTERAKFDEAAKAMQFEVSKMATAAKAHNLDTLKPAFGAAAKSCAACHDSFRAK
jgi:cytochrome c556